MADYKTRRVRVAFTRKVHPRKFNPIECTMEETADVLTPGKEREVRRLIYKQLKRDVDAACEKILAEEAIKDDDEDDD